jgi:hypothetical protein
MNRGVLRLFMATTLLWLFVSALLYMAGLDQPFLGSTVLGKSSEKNLSSLEIASLPTQEDYGRKMEVEDVPVYSAWEVLWLKATAGNLPTLYERDSSGPNCQYMTVRNKGGAVLDYPTTCKSAWSWWGFLLFLTVPVLLIGTLFVMGTWVVNGFRDQSNPS